jgi:hypothetical protein
MSEKNSENHVHPIFVLMLIASIIFMMLMALEPLLGNTSEPQNVEQDMDTVNDYVAVPSYDHEGVEEVHKSVAETKANAIGYTFKGGYGVSVTTEEQNK